jgi:hypothetical protein
MTLATSPTGALINTGWTLTIGQSVIPLKILPDVSDSKSAQYNDEPVMGRSFPIKTYAYSENRTIGMTVYFYADTQQALNCNWTYCRIIQSATYPRSTIQMGNMLPYRPPQLCQLKGSALLATGPLCVVIKRYGLKIPRDVPLDPTTLIPYYFTMDIEMDVVYNSTDLPGQERIISDVNFTQACFQ